MSSGFSYKGGPSPCFSKWQKFQACYLETDKRSECQPQLAEYFSCLHFPKMNGTTEVSKQEINNGVKHAE